MQRLPTRGAWGFCSGAPTPSSRGGHGESPRGATAPGHPRHIPAGATGAQRERPVPGGCSTAWSDCSRRCTQMQIPRAACRAPGRRALRAGHHRVPSPPPGRPRGAVTPQPRGSPCHSQDEKQKQHLSLNQGAACRMHQLPACYQQAGIPALSRSQPASCEGSAALLFSPIKCSQTTPASAGRANGHPQPAEGCSLVP